MENKGKVLEFGRDSEFYVRLGDRLMEDGDMPGAIRNYRIAYEKDPEDVDAVFALSEALNEAGRFEESIRLLLVYMCLYGPVPEFFYGLSCNYYALNEFRYALETAEMYLCADPDGSYAESAGEIVDIIGDEEEMASLFGLEEGENPSVLTACTVSQQLLDAGQAEEALAYIRQAETENPSSWRLKLSVANALYETGRRTEAETVISQVCREDPDNIPARYLKTKCLLRSGKRAEAIQELDQTDFGHSDNPAVALAAAHLQAELGRYADGLATVKCVLEKIPCNTDALHLLGYLSHETGDEETAKRCYLDLLSIDASDTVASFFLELLGRSDTGKKNGEHFPLEYRVTIPESIRRFAEVTEFLNLPAGERKDQWMRSAEVRALLGWALHSGEEAQKEQILSFYSTMEPDTAERLLRDYVLWIDAPKERKKQALYLLHKIGAPQPYMTYMDGHWTEAHMSEAVNPERIPEAYRRVLNTALQTVAQRENGTELSDCAEKLMGLYLAHLNGKYPQISPAQEKALSAALEYMAEELTGEGADEKAICSAYGVTSQRLYNALEKLMSAFPGMEESD